MCKMVQLDCVKGSHTENIARYVPNKIDDLKSSQCCENNEFLIAKIVNNQIEKKLSRLIFYIKDTFKFNDAVWVHTKVYLDRYNKRNNLCKHNIKAVLYACVILSIKYIYDTVPSNKCFARIIEIPTQDLNKLEISVLKELDFELYIDDDEYQKTETQLSVSTNNFTILPAIIKHYD